MINIDRDTNLIPVPGMILIAILTILDIVTRGLPITWSNFTVINLGAIISIILGILDFATKGKYTKGKYETRLVTLITLAICLITLLTITSLSHNF